MHLNFNIPIQRNLHRQQYQLLCLALIDVANYVTFSFLALLFKRLVCSAYWSQPWHVQVFVPLTELPVLVHLLARCVLWFWHRAETKWPSLRNHCNRHTDLPLTIPVFRISAFKYLWSTFDFFCRLSLRNMIHSFSGSKSRRLEQDRGIWLLGNVVCKNWGWRSGLVGFTLCSWIHTGLSNCGGLASTNQLPVKTAAYSPPLLLSPQMW